MSETLKSAKNAKKKIEKTHKKFKPDKGPSKLRDENFSKKTLEVIAKTPKPIYLKLPFF